MTLPKYNQLSDINDLGKIQEEIIFLQKTLFDLRMKKFTNQGIKPHLFAHTKRRIAQFKTKINSFQKSS